MQDGLVVIVAQLRQVRRIKIGGSTSKSAGFEVSSADSCGSDDCVLPEGTRKTNTWVVDA